MKNLKIPRFFLTLLIVVLCSEGSIAVSICRAESSRESIIHDMKTHLLEFIEQTGSQLSIQERISALKERMRGLRDMLRVKRQQLDTLIRNNERMNYRNREWQETQRRDLKEKNISQRTLIKESQQRQRQAICDLKSRQRDIMLNYKYLKK